MAEISFTLRSIWSQNVPVIVRLHLGLKYHSWRQSSIKDTIPFVRRLVWVTNNLRFSSVAEWVRLPMHETSGWGHGTGKLEMLYSHANRAQHGRLYFARPAADAPGDPEYFFVFFNHGQAAEKEHRRSDSDPQVHKIRGLGGADSRWLKTPQTGWPFQWDRMAQPGSKSKLRMRERKASSDLTLDFQKPKHRERRASQIGNKTCSAVSS